MTSPKSADILAVEFEGRRHDVLPGARLMFGRDPVCGICLDSADSGISRVSGSVGKTGAGWAVTNLSRKRALHVVDPTGFAVPLPVAAEGAPPSSRVIDQPFLTVLIAGDLWTHALRLVPPDRTAADMAGAMPTDPVSTLTQAPRLTERRREVIVALARGYLRPYPHYDPRPATYQEAADLLGLTKSQVVKRVEQVRLDLVAVGVQGLDRELDARRTLCEWMLAMRLIDPSDLDWLQPRIDAARLTRRGKLL